MYSGMSFWPSTRKLANYKLLKVGYNIATYNMSYGKGAGFCEIALSLQYTMKGYHNGRSPYDFYNHLRPISIENKLWKKQTDAYP